MIIITLVLEKMLSKRSKHWNKISITVEQKKNQTIQQIIDMKFSIKIITSIVYRHKIGSKEVKRGKDHST